MRLVPILHYEGTPITARFIARAIGEHLDAIKVDAAACRQLGAVPGRWAKALSRRADPRQVPRALPRGTLCFAQPTSSSPQKLIGFAESIVWRGGEIRVKLTTMIGLVWRTLVILHRYLGIAVGLLMLTWFLSGIVMMYVGFPQPAGTERLHGLPPVAWASCCHVEAES